MKRSILFVLIAVAVLASAALGWRYYSQQQAAQPSTSDTGREVNVRRGTLVSTVRASGSIEPEDQVALNFGMAGTVAQVFVEEGQAVKEGDVLARLDTRELELAVAQAEKAYLIGQLAYSQTLAAPKPEELAAAEALLVSAQAQYNDLLAGPKGDQLAAAEAQLAQARAQFKAADEAHNMTMKCFSFHLPNGQEDSICPGLGTYEEQARLQAQAAQAGLEAAQAGYNQVADGAGGAQRSAAKAQVQQAQANLARLAPDENRVALARVQMKQAQIALEQARQRLVNAQIVAPFDGVIVEVNLARGQTAGGGLLPALVLVDLSQYHITLNVDEIDVGRLQTGQVVSITVEALPDQVFTGQVERIARVATVSGVVVAYQVTIKLDPTDLPLRAGMSANVSIVAEVRTGVLIVPNWAIRIDRATGRAYVNLKQAEGVREVEIVAGVRNESDSEVISGLAEGDVVVTGGIEGLRSFIESRQNR